MNPLSAEQQVRMQLAITYKIESVDTLDTIFKWVMGTKSTILPVSKLVEVKQ